MEVSVIVNECVGVGAIGKSDGKDNRDICNQHLSSRTIKKQSIQTGHETSYNNKMEEIQLAIRNDISGL